MAEFIGIAVTGERRTELQFEQFPKFAHARLKAALDRIAQRLSAVVRSESPSREVKDETGGRVYDHGDRIIASVGVRASQDSNFHGKAGALEYGAKRPFQVRAHAATLDHLWGRAIAPITIEVGAHMRTPNIQPHRYLRGPAARLREEHLMLLRQAVEQATVEAQR